MSGIFCIFVGEQELDTITHGVFIALVAALNEEGGSKATPTDGDAGT